jgi:hypothetical protein
MTNHRFASFGFQHRRHQGLLAPIMWLGGVIATVAALTVGAVLAVFTAAAVAVIALWPSGRASGRLFAPVVMTT